MKLNRKGYLIVEIIVASVLAMGIAFFLIRLTISFSRKDEDIYKSITFTNDKNIITNKIMDDVNNYTLTKVEYDSDKNTVTFTYWDNYQLKKLERVLVIDKVNKTITYDKYKKEINGALVIGDITFNSSNKEYTSIVIHITNIYNNEDYSIKLFIPYSIELTGDNIVYDYSNNSNIGIMHDVNYDEDKGGFVFNGTNSYIDCGLKNYDFKKSITIMIKVKFNSLDGYQHIIGNWEVAGGGIVKKDDNTITFEQYLGGDYRRAKSNTKVVIGKWYTLVGVYDGSKLKLYIDGNLEASVSNNNSIKVSNVPFYIGGNPEFDANNNLSADECSNIVVDNALVYDYALYEDYIKKYASSDYDGLRTSDLLFYYKFK